MLQQAVEAYRFVRIPYFLDKQIIDGGKVVSLKCRQCFTPEEDSW
jgi:hypothetical protein